MRNFLFIGPIDPLPLLMQLQRQPEIWNVNQARREHEGSAHTETDDIWIRWTTHDATDPGEPVDIKALPAWYQLPAIRDIVFALMTRVQAIELGAIFITRIPPGGQVKAHIDQGWHAKRFNTKVYVALQSNSDCTNYAESEKVIMKSGECWMFKNTVPHAVTNYGPDDRISLIICMRCED